MRAFLEPLPQAADNTVNIARRCNVEFDFKTRHFPKFETPPGKTENEVFEEKARQGLAERWQYIREQNVHSKESIYQDRLENEIDIIKKMKLSGYFMVVADLVEYARNSNIPVGPGRGSAAGSLVNYSLGITDLDPIANGLLFERFLNTDRKSIPDIALDFCINRRGEVFQYLEDKYNQNGDTYVAQLITFGRMRHRAAIRDVGRVLDIPFDQVNKIAGLIPVGAKNREEAMEKAPALKELIDGSPEYGELMKACRHWRVLIVIPPSMQPV